MIHPGQIALLKEQGCRWLTIYLSLWLAVAYLWLALFFSLMCAPYDSTSYADFDYTPAFEHTVTPFSVVMSVPVEWSKFVAPEMTDTPTWLVDAQSTVTGLTLTFINVLMNPLWAGLVWVKPPHSVTLLLREHLQQLHLVPPERPPRLAFV
jgi:hypothetical protein